MTNEELIEQLKENVYVKVSGPMSARPLHGTTDVWARKRGIAVELRMGFMYLLITYSTGLNKCTNSIKLCLKI